MLTEGIDLFDVLKWGLTGSELRRIVYYDLWSTEKAPPDYEKITFEGSSTVYIHQRRHLCCQALHYSMRCSVAFESRASILPVDDDCQSSRAFILSSCLIPLFFLLYLRTFWNIGSLFIRDKWYVNNLKSFTNLTQPRPWTCLMWMSFILNMTRQVWIWTEASATKFTPFRNYFPLFLFRMILASVSHQPSSNLVGTVWRNSLSVSHLYLDLLQYSKYKRTVPNIALLTVIQYSIFGQTVANQLSLYWIHVANSRAVHVDFVPYRSETIRSHH